MNKVFVFDYDDTLAHNVIYYNLANLAFLNFAVDRLGVEAPAIETILQTVTEFDLQQVQNGKKEKNYADVLEKAWKKIVKKISHKRIKIQKKDLIKVRKMGALAHNPTYFKKFGLINGALKTLKFLRKKNAVLILLTKGTPKIKKQKLKATGVEYTFGTIVLYHDMYDGRSVHKLDYNSPGGTIINGLMPFADMARLLAV